MADITVNPAVSYQTFLGWDVVAYDALAGALTSGPNWHSEVMDAAAEMGLNSVRVEWQSGWIENTTDYWGIYEADGRDDATNAGQPALGNNRNVPVNDNADPNDADPTKFFMSNLDWHYQNYVLPLRTRLATAGDQPPYWYICFVHFSASNRFYIDTPAEYGEAVLQIWNYFNSTYGEVPDGLEIQLEPTNHGTTGAQLAAMVVAARDRLIAAGYSLPDIMAPSHTDGSLAEALYDDIKTADATAAGYISHLTYHRYSGGITDGELTTFRTKADTDGKDMFMSEWISANARTLYSDLVFGRNALWQQYTFADFIGGGDDGAKHFIIGASPGYGVTISKRSAYIRQYSKFIRRGAVMKGVTNSSGAHLGVAFQNPNGKWIVVIKSTSAGANNVKGLPDGTYKIKYSTGASAAFDTTPVAYDVDLTPQVVSGGSDVVLPSVAAFTIVTVYDENYLAPLATTNYYGNAPTPRA